MLEQTLVLFKPDAVQRGLVGEILMRFERAGLRIAGMKLVWVDSEFSRKHYAEHVEKPFYKVLENMITSGPVLAFVLEGVEAISIVRKMVGGTEPKSSLPGTIRGDYAHMSYGYADTKGIGLKNLIHASSSASDAKREVDLWFAGSELHKYKTVHDMHIFE